MIDSHNKALQGNNIVYRLNTVPGFRLGRDLPNHLGVNPVSLGEPDGSRRERLTPNRPVASASRRRAHQTAPATRLLFPPARVCVPLDAAVLPVTPTPFKRPILTHVVSFFFFLAGSASLLSESIHSFADLGNQVYMFMYLYIYIYIYIYTGIYINKFLYIYIHIYTYVYIYVIKAPKCRKPPGV